VVDPGELETGKRNATGIIGIGEEEIGFILEPLSNLVPRLVEALFAVFIAFGFGCNF